MQVYLCEKPSQGRDLAKVLGLSGGGQGSIGTGNVKVTWCIGHLLEQKSPDEYTPDWKKWSLDNLPMLPGDWQLAVKTSVKEQFAVVKKCLADASCVYIATDGDREGETLGREVLDYCKYKGEIKRVWLTALDDKSIKKALDKILPGEQTESLYHAGLGRSRADWLVGMNLSRLFTLASGSEKPLSVGRVQTPTLKLVVDRDREIEAFKPKDFFELYATFATQSGDTFIGKWQAPEDQTDDSGRCLKRDIAEQIKQAIDGKQGSLSSVETKRKKQKPPALFSLSRLQQIASARFGFGADQTLKVAQSLYETHKATTYPRSDSEFLPDEQFDEMADVMQAVVASDPAQQSIVAGADLSKKPACFDTKKVTAHHAIIPTASTCDLEKMSRDERKLYELIRQHFIAQFYPDFEFDETTILTDVDQHRFKTTGRVTVKDGWKAILNDSDEADDKAEQNESKQILPVVTQGDQVNVTDSTIKALKTTPPARFTEGTLIVAMKTIGKYVDDPELKKKLKETTGIGTEATRASIIKTLLDRGFIANVKNKLISSDTGRYLVDVLPIEVTSPATTALWEQKLDEIVSGERVLEMFLVEQFDYIKAIVEQTKDQGIDKIDNGDPDVACPDCGSAMKRRKGKFGFFWGCTGYPDCKTLLKDEKGKPVAKAKATPTDKVCPDCSKPMVLRGKPGSQFYGCSGYPDCKKTEEFNDPKHPTVNCPKCQSKLIRRKGKKGFFWGCSGYPACNYVANDVKGKPSLKSTTPA